MKSVKVVFKAFGWLLLVAVVASALLVGAALWFGTPMDPTVIHIDDTSLQITDLGAGHGLLALAGITLACAIVLLVVPLAVLLPLALAAIGVTVALAIAAAVIGVMFSPLILVAGVIWWAVRRNRGSQPPAPPATSSPQTPPQAPATIAG